MVNDLTVTVVIEIISQFFLLVTMSCTALLFLMSLKSFSANETKRHFDSAARFKTDAMPIIIISKFLAQDNYFPAF